MLDEFIAKGIDFILFCPTKNDCMEAWHHLRRRHPAAAYQIAVLHSNLSDVFIAAEITKWKSGGSFGLVATALASNVSVVLSMSFILQFPIVGNQQEECACDCSLGFAMGSHSLHTRGQIATVWLASLNLTL